MLPLTPAPLQTAGERALFAELTRWDTGGAVRGAVIASIPVVDGQLQRRLSDAVLLVPEGVAVIRVVEVPYQRGVVTVVPEGSWTIGPAGQPGDVLRMGGGGSTPLDGLMRAGMDAAVRLRRAGLEPGKVARLTVLVGDLEGLEPSDGDLGEGDQVAVLEPRSLLLGIARAARYAGTDNPRLWTTADVRAALEALGLEGRGPTVEELNGEGFPYSPYVLRKRELLAPAAMAASPASRGAAPTATGVQEAAVRAVPVGDTFGGPAPAPLVDPAAAAAVAAAAVRADEEAARARSAAAWVAAPATRVQRDTIEVGADPRLAGARPASDPAAAPSVPPVAPVVAEDTGGLGGLFGTAPAAPAAPAPAVPPSAPPTSFLSSHDEPPVHASEQEAPGRRRGVLLLALAVVVVVVLGVAGYLTLRPHGTSAGSGAAAPTTPGATVPTSEPSGPQVGDTRTERGTTFRLEQSQADTGCATHAYGAVAQFFSTGDCTGLSRGLYSAQAGGHPAVVAISRVQMPDSAGARALQQLADTSDTGNVSDLLREGVHYAGGPQKLGSDREYASAISGRTVTIVETGWVDPANAGAATDLQTLATAALPLDLPPFPAG